MGKKKVKKKKVKRKKKVKKRKKKKKKKIQFRKNHLNHFSKKQHYSRKTTSWLKKKTVAFNHTRDFLCQIYYDKPEKNNLPGGISPELANYNVTGITALLADPKNKNLLMFENQTQKARI